MFSLFKKKKLNVTFLDMNRKWSHQAILRVLVLVRKDNNHFPGGSNNELYLHNHIHAGPEQPRPSIPMEGKPSSLKVPSDSRQCLSLVGFRSPGQYSLSTRTMWHWYSPRVKTDLGHHSVSLVLRGFLTSSVNNRGGLTKSFTDKCIPVGLAQCVQRGWHVLCFGEETRPKGWVLPSGSL